ncbi:MAG: hypothetical protein HC860_07725 [Alkalinema sp. RU_4_3]|nr:hypothetical protein [Alkalinema sp. RU_4_3]
MQPEQQQRIMGYFIEEAKDHLNTIEQGLLNLQNTLDDSEMANEVFRAAHSVKGGAAMLGLGSIQRVSHRLEDFFKILKETPSVRTDQKLESLLLRVFDTLQELLEHLQEPFGLTEEAASTSMDGIEPVFSELEQHLSQLVAGAGAAPAAPAALSWFQQQVPVGLRAMLELFKQADSVSDARSQLQSCCTQLKAPSAAALEWNLLVDQVHRAIGIPENGYRTLAGVVLKDLKQAQELVLSGRTREVAASPALQALLPLAADAGLDNLFDLNSTGDDLDLGLTGEVGEFDLAGLETGELDFSLGGDLDGSDDLNLDGFSLEGESDDLGLGDLVLDGDDSDLSLGDLDLDSMVSDSGDDLLDPNLLNSFADGQEGDEDLWQDLSETPVVPTANSTSALEDDMGLGLFDSETEGESFGGLDLEGSDLLELDEDSTASLENLGELFMGLDESDLTFVQEEDDFFGAEGEEDGGMGELDLDLFDLPESTAVGSGIAAAGDLDGLDFDGMDLFDSDPLAMPTSVEVSRDVVAEDSLGLGALELDGDEDSFSEAPPRTDYTAGLGDNFGLDALDLDEGSLSLDLGEDSAESDDLGLGELNLDEMVLDESGDLGDLNLDGLGDEDFGVMAVSSSDDSTFLHGDLDGEMALDGSLNLGEGQDLELSFADLDGGSGGSEEGGLDDLSFDDLMGDGATDLQLEDGLDANLMASDLGDDSVDLSEFDLDGGASGSADSSAAFDDLGLGGDDSLLDMSDLDGFDLGEMPRDDLGGLDGAIADPGLDMSLGSDDLDGFLDDPAEASDAEGGFDFNALMGGARSRVVPWWPEMPLPSPAVASQVLTKMNSMIC